MDAKACRALNNAEMSALLGEPVEASAPAAAAAAPTAPAAPAAPAAKAASGPISAEVAKWVAEGKKWSKSTIAAEQARRGRKSLPALTDAEVAALLGEPAPQKHRQPLPVAAAVARPAAAAPRPAAGPPSAAATVSRGGEFEHLRRHAGGRNFESSRVRGRGFDRTRRQRYQSGAPALCLGRVRGVHDGVVHRLLPLLSAAHAVRAGHFVQDRLSRRFRLGRRHQVSAEIPHLGGPHARPHFRDLRALHSPGLHSRLEAEREQVQVPCHGSGYDSEGVNFEGPAPRPMDRAKVEIAPDGQILVDVSKLYQWPKGQPSQFNDPGSFLPT